MTVFRRNASMWAYVALSLGIAALDTWRGVRFSLWALHFVPMGLAAWNLGAKAGCTMAGLAVGLLCAEAFWAGHPYSSVYNLAWSYASKAVAYALVVYFVSALRKKEVVRAYVPPRGS